MKMTKKFDKLNETFNVDSDIVSVDVESETVTEKIEKVALVVDDVKKDYDYTRGNLYSLIEKGQEAINGILELAQESEMPRAYESGFNTPGQTIKPTEVGIGVPVEGSCNHTKKGKSCPKHGMKDCTLIGKTLNSVTEEGILAWFRSKSKDNVPGWVDVVTGDSCASDKPREGITKCVSSSKRDIMTPAERRSAKARKRAADPGQQEKSNAAKPTYVPTDSPTKKMKEEFFKENHKEIADGREKDEEGYMASTEMDTIDSAIKKLRKNIKKSDTQLPAWVQSKITKAADYIDTAADYLDSNEMSEESDRKGKGSGTKDACYHKVKSRYSVWPSAYASGALVKCRNVGAANWGNKSESLSPISIKVLEDLNLDEKCWSGYKKKGMKTMFGKRYPNCVKVEEKDTCNHTHKGEVCPTHGKKECPTEVNVKKFILVHWFFSIKFLHFNQECH
jgi:hypothetical protein